MSVNITVQMLQRLPQYLNYLKSLPQNRITTISATTIAEALKQNDVQVRKDLAAVSDGGKPKIGYITQDLIHDLEQFLGYDDVNDAVIVGIGNLGHALLSYDGFSEYGLNIVAGFDINETILDTEVRGKKIFSVDKLQHLSERMKIKIGIIAVPVSEAQAVCNIMVQSGIMAIWNFAPVHLSVPETILVQNENMAASLILLSRHLNDMAYHTLSNT